MTVPNVLVTEGWMIPVTNTLCISFPQESSFIVSCLLQTPCKEGTQRGNRPDHRVLMSAASSNLLSSISPGFPSCGSLYPHPHQPTRPTSLPFCPTSLQFGQAIHPHAHASWPKGGEWKASWCICSSKWNGAIQAAQIESLGERLQELQTTTFS